MPRSPYLIALAILPWSLALAGLAWLFVHRFPPSGVVTINVPFDGRSAWINPFLPSERVTPPGAQEGNWRGQRIVGDPVYTSARIPGIYDRVAIEMDFRTLRQPLLELGLVNDLAAGDIDFRPVWFEPLQDPRWNAVTGVGYRLPGASLSDTRTTAVWHATSTELLLSDDAHEIKTTRVTLRGAHDFYAVPAGGRVVFRFEIQDANRSAGRDAVAFRFFRGSEELGTDVLGIGGSQDTRMGRVFEKTIEIPNATPGVYRVQVNMDDDVFIRSIATNTIHWVVGPRLVFGDDVGFATSTQPGVAWTDSRHLVFETFHREGLQQIAFGTQTLEIARTHDLFRLDRMDAGGDAQRLDAPYGDVRIIGDGWFSFSPEAWFAPQPRRITDASNPEQEGARAVLTSYARPQELGDGWYRARAVFDVDPSEDTLRLALSAPGIGVRSGAVDIRNVRLTYERPPLSWNAWIGIVTQELKNAVRRFRQ